MLSSCANLLRSLSMLIQLVSGQSSRRYGSITGISSKPLNSPTPKYPIPISNGSKTFHTAASSGNDFYHYVTVPLPPGANPDTNWIDVDDASDTCIDDGPTCFANGTLVSELRDECMLWDDTCSGNKTQAINQFYGKTRRALLQNHCFIDMDCGKEIVSQLAGVKSWMRSPQCQSSSKEFHGTLPKPEPVFSTMSAHDTCCDSTCMLMSSDVNIFYWPELNVDTSCLSIVGNSVSPIDHGATTDSLKNTYWGCLIPDPTEGYLTIRTATLGSQISLSYKRYWPNPWDETRCQSMTAASTGMVRYPYSNATYHPLVRPSSITKHSGSPISTLVSGAHTFVSPSVYAEFYNIGMYDDCGSTTYASTMIALSPGELSTVGGQFPIGDGKPPKSFNFRDLPCPPQNVASANWWKPSPGEPYRPIIAPISRLTQALGLGRCTMSLFLARDPPRTLDVGKGNMLSDSNPNSSPTLTPVAAATATRDPLAQNTAANQDSHVSPASVPKPDLPKQTRGPSLEPTSQDPNAVLPASVPANKPTQSAQETQGPSNPPPQNAGSIDPGIVSGPKPDQTTLTIPQGHGNGNQPIPISSNEPQRTQDTSNNNPANDHSDIPAAAQTPSPRESSVQPETATPIIKALASELPNIYQQLTANLIEPAQSVSPSPVVAPQSKAPTAGVIPHILPAPSSNAAVDTKVSPSAPGVGNAIVAAIKSALPNPPGSTPSTQPQANNNPLTVNGLESQSVPTRISVADESLLSGVPAVIISNIPVSGGESALEVATNEAAHVPPMQNPPVAEGTTAANPDIKGPLTGISIGASTNMPGRPAATISNDPIPLGKEPPVKETQATPIAPPAEQPSIATLAGHTIQPAGNGISIAGTTLTPGAAQITVSGTPISLGLSAFAIGTNTVPHAPPTQSPSPAVIADHTIQAADNGISIAGTTLTPGATGITISGTPISLDPSAFAVGTNTVPYTAPAQTPPPTVIADYTIQPLPNGISIAGTTLTPHALGITISGTPISLGSSAFIYGTHTIPYSAPPATTKAFAKIAGQPFAPIPNGNGISIAGTTLTPGAAAITTLGTPISLGSSALIVGESTISYAQPSPSPSITTIANQVLNPLPNGEGVSIGGTTLKPGAPAVIVSGAPILLDLSTLIIGESTIPYAPPSPTAIATTIAGQGIDALPYINGISIAGTSLTPGAPAVTISGTRVSLGSGAMVVDTSTISYNPRFASESVFVTHVGSQAITANPTGVVMAGTTLTPGASGVTISDTPVTLGSNGVLVVGSTTVTLNSGSRSVGGDSAKQTAATTSVGSLSTVTNSNLSVPGSSPTPTGSAGTSSTAGKSGSSTDVPDSGAKVVNARTTSGWRVAVTICGTLFAMKFLG